FGEPGLTDAGLAQDYRGPAASAQGSTKRLIQQGELLLSVDQRRMAGCAEESTLRFKSCQPRPSFNLVRRDNGPAAGDHLAIGAPRLFGWVYPELATQDVHARLILAQRVPEAPLPGVETHQRPVGLLSQRVEHQEPGGSLDRRFRRSRIGLMWHQPGKYVDGSFPQACPFTPKPLLEGVLADIEAIQQISDVEGSGLLEGFWTLERGQPFELGDVDVDRRPIESDSIAFDHHDSWMKGGEDTSDRAQALTEALSGLLFARTAPQHRRELVSRVVLFRSYREVGEQGLVLPRGKRQASFALPGLKSPQKPKSETRHRAFPEFSDCSHVSLR